MLKIASSLASPKTRGDATARRAAGLRLARDVARFMDGPRPPYQSRLEPLHELVEILGPAWDAETEPAARAGLARVLEVITSGSTNGSSPTRRPRAWPSPRLAGETLRPIRTPNPS